MEAKGLVVSLREQPIEPGARREGRLDWTVSSGWNSEVLRLPEGSVVPLDLAITTIDEGVVAELSGEVVLQAECVRCLRPIEVEQPIDSSEVFVYPDSVRDRGQRGSAQRETGIESEGDEMDAALLIDRDSIDLEPVLRDAVFSEAPLRPVCSEDCMGICEHCGVLLAEAPADHKHEFLDPRFAVLADFFGEDQGSGEGEQA